jgi:hypothetical protein
LLRLIMSCTSSSDGCTLTAANEVVMTGSNCCFVSRHS